MTPVEWTQVKNRVDALWGKTSKWINYGDIIAMVQHVPYNQAIRSVNQMVGAKYAPAPADVIAACKPDAQRLRRPTPAECRSHVFGVIEYRATERLEMCTRCLEERIVEGQP